MSAFKDQKNEVVTHIPSKYVEEMATRSKVVRIMQ